MQLYIFLIITVLLIVKPTVNALFLSKLGADQLPYAYLLVALIAVITSYFYNRAIKKFSLLKITIISLVIFSLSFITLSLILNYNLLSDWVLFAYYLGVSLFAVIATSQFWILANMVFNPREGKRLFGFIGAGAIAGGIFGGYLTSIIASTFSNKVVIMLAAILILCCIPVIKKIWSLRINKMNTYIRNQRKAIISNTDESSSLKVVLNSKHLTYLALITGIGVFVAKLVDFQFSDFANKAISDPDELASFFGFWFSSFNVIALSIQLFLTNRILTKLGVSSSLLILPLAIALGSLLFLTFPELWVLVIIKGIDGSFKQSLNKAAVELSIMPIPLHIKNQAKSFIDVAVDSVATGIAGFILIFFIKKLDLNTSYVTVIILLFVFVWILLIYRLREAYYNSFRENIQRTLSENNKLNQKARNETTLVSARRIFNEGNESEILALLDRLSPYKLKTLKYNIVGLLEHPSNHVKSEAIKQLYAYDKGTALEKVESLIIRQDDDLIYTALNYIFHHSSTSTDSFFGKYLDHQDDYISNAALLCLAKEASSNQKLSIRYRLDKRLEDRINDSNIAENLLRQNEVSTLLNIIAYSHNLKYYYFIALHLKNKNIFIVKQAIKAAGVTASDQFIETLLDYLSVKTYRKRTIEALKNYGPKIIDTIVNLDKIEDIDDKTKQYLPRVIKAFNTQKALNILINLLSSKDVVIRLEASASLAKLKNKNAKLVASERVLRQRILLESRFYKRTLDAIATLTHLINVETTTNAIRYESNEIRAARQSIIDLLEDQLEYSLRCIFNLLSVIYNQSDIEMTYSGLLSDVKEARLNALEFLDNMLKSRMKNRILPLIEHYVIEDDNSESSVLNLKILAEKDCLTKLAKRRGRRVKLEVLNLIRNLNDRRYLPLVASLRKHQNKHVKLIAFETYNSLKGVKYKN